MKTTFKRVLGIILALCVLVAGATCLMGVSVAAETTTVTDGQKTNNLAASAIEGLTTAEKNEKVFASSTAQGKVGYMAFDGVNAENNRWYPGSLNGYTSHYVMIDLGDDYIVTGMKINFRNDQNRRITYGIYAATTLGGLEYTAANKAGINTYLKSYGHALKTGANAYAKDYTGHFAMTTFSSYTKARYLMIDYTSAVDGDMCVYECEVFGYKLSSDKYTVDHTSKTITLASTWKDSDVTAGELAAALDFAGNATLEINKGENEVLVDGDTLTVKHAINSSIADIADKTIADTVYTIKYEPAPYNVPYTALAGLSDGERYNLVFESAAGNGTSVSFSKGHNAFDASISGSNNNHQWYPANKAAWLLFDLGDVYNISGIKALWRNGTDRTYTYDMYAVSNLSDVGYTGDWSRANMTTIANSFITNGADYKILSQQTAQKYKNHLFEDQPKGRYILLNVTAATGEINLAELEVFGYTDVTSSSKEVVVDEATNTISVPYVWSTRTVADLKAVLGGVKGNAYLSMSKADDEVLANGDVITLNHVGTTALTGSTLAYLPTAAETYTVKIESANLALKKSALGHGKGGDQTPSKAVDGNTASNQWMVNGTADADTDRPWIMVDLGASYNLTNVRVYFGSGVGYDHTVYAVDSISTEWSEENKVAIAEEIGATTSITSVSAANSLGGKATDISAKGRYVLVKFGKRNTNNSTLSLFELEIFGYNFTANELKKDDAAKTITIPFSWGKDVTDKMILEDLTVAGGAYITLNGDVLTLTHAKGTTTVTTEYQVIRPNFDSIALNKPILGNKENDGYGVGKINNGFYQDSTTGTAADRRQWMTDGTGPNSADRPVAIIDLGAVYNITSLKPYFDPAVAYDFDIYLADTIAAEWSTENFAAITAPILATTPVVSDKSQTLGGPSVDVNAAGRYLVIKVGARKGGNSTLSMYELDVFGYAVAPMEEGVVVNYTNKTVTVPFTYAGELTYANIATLVDFAGNAVFEVKDGKIIVETMDGETITFTVSRAIPDGSHVNVMNGTVGFYTADNALVQVNPGDEVSVSFEYYTTGSMLYRLQFKDGDNVVFNGLGLPTGRNKFEQTVTVPADGGVLTPYIVRGSSAKIYVWNIKVKVNGEDVNVAYANTSASNATFSTKDAVSAELGLNLDKDHFVTKVDLTDIDASKVDRDIWVGINFGANSNFPAYATDKITFAYDYFLSGNATTVQVSSTAAATAIGNAVGMYDKTNGVVVGAGHMAGVVDQTSTSQWGDSIRAAASVAIRKNSEVYPDYFYVWNLQIDTSKYGRITYLENSAFEVKVYNDYSNQYPNRNAVTLDGVNPTAELVAVDKGEELAYIYADTDDVVMDDLNGDGFINICDSVFLHASATFKDIRAFDKDYKDELKSAADYLYIRNQIWGNK